MYFSSLMVNDYMKNIFPFTFKIFSIINKNINDKNKPFSYFKNYFSHSQRRNNELIPELFIIPEIEYNINDIKYFKTRKIIENGEL